MTPPSPGLQLSAFTLWQDLHMSVSEVALALAREEAITMPETFTSCEMWEAWRTSRGQLVAQ